MASEPLTLLANARIVTPQGTLGPGWIRISGERIGEVGHGRPPGSTRVDEDLDNAWLVPGFIDLHVHGGGGASVGSNPSEVLRVARFHQRHGTTRMLASVATGPHGAMVAATEAVAELMDNGEADLLGAHLEGPFLNRERHGAQDERWVRPPDARELTDLLAAGRGRVRVVTLAPELDGGLDLIDKIRDAGAVAAIGHSEASFDEAILAIKAGVRLATHLFNGMSAMHHRAPGCAIAALDSRDVVCELINDGAHLHDAVARMVFRQAGASRIALVTDAIAAAGMGDGNYLFGASEVTVVDGQVRLADGSSLAGSTLTMDRSFQRAVMRLDIPIEDAVTASSTTPARLIGVDDKTGSIEVGKSADLVMLDAELSVLGVMAQGRWVWR